jgi:hypothetical protein
LTRQALQIVLPDDRGCFKCQTTQPRLDQSRLSKVAELGAKPPRTLRRSHPSAKSSPSLSQAPDVELTRSRARTNFLKKLPERLLVLGNVRVGTT